jgi:hypothetical protein
MGPERLNKVKHNIYFATREAKYVKTCGFEVRIIQFLHMQAILQFNISRDAGSYTAEGVNAPIVTFGTTFEELQNNIREAVQLFFDGEEPTALGFAGLPSILASFELPAALPTISYGGEA